MCIQVCEVGVKSHECFPWLLRHRKKRQWAIVWEHSPAESCVSDEWTEDVERL